MKNFDESIFEKGLQLPLVEEFYTLQGEGFHTGKAAYFIRIGGCDIGCRWCDSKISWSPSIHPLVSIETIVSNAIKTPANAVVVTGGEPSLYNLEPLTSRLREHGIQTFIETAGAKPLTGEWDWICLSPKRQSPPDESFYSIANELKVIIFDDEDYRWAEEIAEKVNKEPIKPADWASRIETINFTGDLIFKAINI